MTEFFRGRIELSTIQEYIEALKSSGGSKETVIAGVLEDIHSDDYTFLSKHAGEEILRESVIQGITYVTQGQEGLDFGVFGLAPNVNGKQIRTTIRDTSYDLFSAVNPVEFQAYDALQQVILDSYRFRTIAAMTISQGVTKSGSKEIVSIAFPKVFRNMINLSTEEEKDRCGLFIANSFLIKAPFNQRSRKV